MRSHTKKKKNTLLFNICVNLFRMQSANAQRDRQQQKHHQKHLIQIVGPIEPTVSMQMCHKHNIIQYYFDVPVEFCVLCAWLPCGRMHIFISMMKSIEDGKKCIRNISDYKPLIFAHYYYYR